MFDWDASNLRKVRAHRIGRDEAEQVIWKCSDPYPCAERFVYYGETDAARLLAVMVTERGEKLRVITAYDLDGRQRRDYLTRRLQGE